MILITLILIFYVIPFIAMYVYTKMSYGEDGINEGQEFRMTYFWIMICPIINILGSMIGWLDEYPRYEYKNEPIKPKFKINNYIGRTIFKIKEKEEVSIKRQIKEQRNTNDYIPLNFNKK